MSQKIDHIFWGDDAFFCLDPTKIKPIFAHFYAIYLPYLPTYALSDIITWDLLVERWTPKNLLTGYA